MTKSTVVTLSNGIFVANFSSAHPFKFEDGTVLEACSAERCKSLMLKTTEVETENSMWTDIELKFSLNDKVLEALKALEDDKGIDIILCPFPMITALKEAGVPLGKVRGCRVADRVTRSICIDKFCI